MMLKRRVEQDPDLLGEVEPYRGRGEQAQCRDDESPDVRPDERNEPPQLGGAERCPTDPLHAGRSNAMKRPSLSGARAGLRRLTPGGQRPSPRRAGLGRAASTCTRTMQPSPSRLVFAP